MYDNVRGRTRKYMCVAESLVSTFRYFLLQSFDLLSLVAISPFPSGDEIDGDNFRNLAWFQGGGIMVFSNRRSTIRPLPEHQPNQGRLVEFCVMRNGMDSFMLMSDA